MEPQTKAKDIRHLPRGRGQSPGLTAIRPLKVRGGNARGPGDADMHGTFSPRALAKVAMPLGNSKNGLPKETAATHQAKEGDLELGRTKCHPSRSGPVTLIQRAVRTSLSPPGGEIGNGVGTRTVWTMPQGPKWWTKPNKYVWTSPSLRKTLPSSKQFWEKTTAKLWIARLSLMPCRFDKKPTSQSCLTNKSSAKICGRSETAMSKSKSCRPPLRQLSSKPSLQQKRRRRCGGGNRHRTKTKR